MQIFILLYVINSNTNHHNYYQFAWPQQPLPILYCVQLGVYEKGLGFRKAAGENWDLLVLYIHHLESTKDR